MLIMSGVMKLIKPAQLVEEFIRLGYQEHQVLVLELSSLPARPSIWFRAPRFWVRSC